MMKKIPPKQLLYQKTFMFGSWQVELSSTTFRILAKETENYNRGVLPGNRLNVPKTAIFASNIGQLKMINFSP